jgi:hypothetical protein
MYEIRASTGRRLRSVAVGLVPAVFFLLAAGSGAYVGAKNSFERSFSVTAITAFIAVFVLVTRRGAGIELAVSAPGFQLAEVTVPWPSIERVVLGSSAVGVRLTPGAPLPDGMTGVVHDARRPEDLHIRQEFHAERIDRERIVAAVRAFAPGVAVVSRDAVPPPQPRPAGQERQDTWAVVTGVRLRTGRVNVYRRNTFSEHTRHKPHPVVNFALPDGRRVVAETGKPGVGEPGERVVVSYDVHDPTDVLVAGGVPRGRWVRTW